MADARPDATSGLHAARAGSPEALGQLLEACRAYLLGIAEREMDAPLKAKGGASDLVQETFLEAHRDFPRFEGNSEAELLGWLRRMLLNNLNNFARHYRGTDKRRLDREIFFDPHASEHGDMPVPAHSATASRLAVADEDSQALENAIQQLPVDYRQVITLRYLQDRSFEEIAEVMGRSNNAVRQLWVRAVTQLQEKLGAG